MKCKYNDITIYSPLLKVIETFIDKYSIRYWPIHHPKRSMQSDKGEAQLNSKIEVHGRLASQSLLGLGFLVDLD